MSHPAGCFLFCTAQSHTVSTSHGGIAAALAWPTLWGFLYPLPCLLTSTRYDPSPSHLWKSQLGCLSSRRRDSSPPPLWKCTIELLYSCLGTYWEYTLPLSCSKLTVNAQTPGRDQCRWLSGETGCGQEQTQAVMDKQWRRCSLEWLSLSLSSFLILQMGNWGSVKGQLKCCFPYGEESPLGVQRYFLQAGAEGVKGSLSFPGVCSYGILLLLRSEHLF